MRSPASSSAARSSAGQPATARAISSAADPQAGDARVVAIEAPRVVEQRGIALGRDPRDDRRDLGADVDLLRRARRRPGARTPRRSPARGRRGAAARLSGRPAPAPTGRAPAAPAPATARRSPRASRAILRTRSRIAASPANTSVTSLAPSAAGSAIIVSSSSRTAAEAAVEPEVVDRLDLVERPAPTGTGSAPRTAPDRPGIRGESG